MYPNAQKSWCDSWYGKDMGELRIPKCNHEAAGMNPSTNTFLFDSCVSIYAALGEAGHSESRYKDFWSDEKLLMFFSSESLPETFLSGNFISHTIENSHDEISVLLGKRLSSLPFSWNSILGFNGSSGPRLKIGNLRSLSY